MDGQTYSLTVRQFNRQTDQWQAGSWAEILMCQPLYANGTKL